MLDRHLLFEPGQGGLIESELVAALELATAALGRAEPGRVGEGELVPEVRRSTVAWLEISDESSWLFSRVYSLAYAANESRWDFDLVGPHRRLQVSKYEAHELGMYDWHLDIGAGTTNTRKVTVTFELSKASEGGVMQFRPGSRPSSIVQDPGSAVVFPAFIPHRLTPVTRGCRVSLVGWVCGPPFR